MSTNKQNQLERLLVDVRACTLCEPHLPHGVRPVLQLHTTARLLLVGQAPGRRVHASGIPFDDPSGDRLRHWMGITRETFYDPSRVAILPMGFCYPGTGKSGDLAPRSECASTWRLPLMAALKEVRLTLVIGRYAMDWHLKVAGQSLTQTLADWKRHLPAQIPLPHPSPRNNTWVKKNPNFELEVLPYLRARVQHVLEA